jgi:hypothetical protein
MLLVDTGQPSMRCSAGWLRPLVLKCFIGCESLLVRMDKATVLKQVEETLRAISGVKDVWTMDQQGRSRLESIEREAESHGACGGLMPFVNRGVWATMSREVVVVIVIGSSIPLIGDQFNIVYIEDQNKQVIGEYLTPERQEEFKDRADVCHIGPDFIIYGDRPMVGEPYFVLPELEFHFLDHIKEVMDVTSGSISTLADDWIRERLGFAETKHWTHIVGFNLRGD